MITYEFGKFRHADNTIIWAFFSQYSIFENLNRLLSYCDGKADGVIIQTRVRLKFLLMLITFPALLFDFDVKKNNGDREYIAITADVLPTRSIHLAAFY